MTNFIYTKDIPDAPNNPSNDQGPMKVNTNSIFDLIDVDHHGFNDNLGGYHDIIHQNAQLADPAAIAGPPQINQIYVKSVAVDTNPASAADTQLFTRTALGGISQLTGAHSATRGYQWLGGVLLQWGFISLGALPSGTETFQTATTPPFPTACLNVVATLRAKTALGSSSSTISIGTFNATSFGWLVGAQDLTKWDGFYWIAIGN